MATLAQKAHLLQSADWRVIRLIISRSGDFGDRASVAARKARLDAADSESAPAKPAQAPVRVAEAQAPRRLRQRDLASGEPETWDSITRLATALSARLDP
jgi:hypothetical protein